MDPSLRSKYLTHHCGRVTVVSRTSRPRGYSLRVGVLSYAQSAYVHGSTLRLCGR